MRVAILGGGASGLAAAWLLDRAHEVTIFEKERRLGGHVCTLGLSVPCETLPAGVRLDSGVIEFDRSHFPVFHAWMDALGVVVEDLVDGGSTSLYLADGRSYHGRLAMQHEHPSRLARLGDWAHLLPLLRLRRRFLRLTARLRPDELARHEIEDFLGDDDFSLWVRSLLMYAYSMPYEQVEHLSAAMVLPMLQQFLGDNRWTRIPGGASTYVERVQRSLRGQVHLGAKLRGVRRVETGVEVLDEQGHASRFDAVILAVPPHRVLPLLLDASDDERERFGGYRGGAIETVIHQDVGFYERRGIRWYSEFDLFELPSGGHGYNAYLNRLAGLAPGPPCYSLAFQMDGELDPARVLHRQSHDVASYTQQALAHREEIEAAQGDRRTWFVGAFLGDGLQEGAVRSSLRVARLLGGRDLPVEQSLARCG